MNKIWIAILVFVLSLAGRTSAFLMAHYEFEGNVTDSAGSYDGTLVGDPAYAPGVFGWAIKFDGIDDYVNCGNNSIFNLDDEITVAAWVNINAVDKAWQAIVTKGDSAWRLSTSDMQNKFHFAVTGYPSYHCVDGVTEVSPGEWHHVCGTFDGHNIRLYLDGELDNVASYEGYISANTYDVCVGENAEAPGRYWNGLIDDVRIYTNEQGPTSIKAMMEVPLGSGEAFTYEGRLLDEGSPADGPHDFQFKLYDAPVLGTQEGNTIDINDLDVIDGYFIAELDFGSDVFDGNQRWLQIGVRPGASTDTHTILNPRIAVAPTPYALYAFSCTSLDAADGSPEDVVYVDSVGNVGIGTVNPGRILDVDGHIRLRPGTAINAGIWLTDSSDIEEWFVGKTNIAGTNQIGMYKSGWKMVVQDKGNVGIGTTSPETNLHLYKGAGGGSDPIALVDPFVVESDNNAYINVITPNDKWGGMLFSDEERDRGAIRYNHTTDTMDFRTANTTQVTFNSFGNVGIGTSNPGGKLHVKAHDMPHVVLEEDGTSSKNWHLAVYNSDLVFSETAVSDRMVIKPGGNVGIGTITPGSARLAVMGGNVGVGTTNPGANLDVVGKIRVSNSAGDPLIELGEGLDYAEGFDVSDSARLDKGSVLIIDVDNPGKLTVSNKPYDTRVAGIVAGANGIGSGVRLGAGQFDYDVALAGRVYCKVDATKQAVQPGDLLTTSLVPGHAMKATDYTRAQGAILGKAMESLEKGQKGQILVLVTLQ